MQIVQTKECLFVGQGTFPSEQMPQKDITNHFRLHSLLYWKHKDAVVETLHVT